MTTRATRTPATSSRPLTLALYLDNLHADELDTLAKLLAVANAMDPDSRREAMNAIVDERARREIRQQRHS